MTYSHQCFFSNLNSLHFTIIINSKVNRTRAISIEHSNKRFYAFIKLR